MSSIWFPIWYVSACRLGKPSSIWAKRFYGPEKMRQARVRFEPVLTQQDLDRIPV